MSNLTHLLDQLRSLRGVTVHPWVFTASHQTFQLRLARSQQPDLFLTMGECHSVSFVEGWHLNQLTIEQIPGMTPERLLVRDGHYLRVECERAYLSETGLTP